MTEWRQFKLKDILEPDGYIRGPFGSSLRRGELKNEGIPVYEQEHAIKGIRKFRYYIDQNKFNELKRFCVKTGDIIISCSGTVGEVSVIKEEDPKGIISQALLILRADKNVAYQPFLKYFLMSPYGKSSITSRSDGSVQVNIAKRQVIENIDILLPPLPEQKAIAEVLSSLDDKIDLLTRQNKTLEDLAQAYFRKWFIEDASDEWEVGKAKDYFEIGIGKTPPRKEEHWFSKNNNDVVWVSISDMGKAGMFIGDSSEYLTKNAVKQFNIKRVPKGAIILSFKLTVGRVAIALRDFTTNEAIAHFIYRNLYEREYLYFYLKTFDYYSLGSTSSIATAVNSKIIKDMPFVMPDVETLKKYHKIAAPMFSKIESNTNQILTLQKIRDTLLPKLISGEIRVKM